MSRYFLRALSKRSKSRSSGMKFVCWISLHISSRAKQFEDNFERQLFAVTWSADKERYEEFVEAWRKNISELQTLHPN